MTARVVIFDGDRKLRARLARQLKEAGYEVTVSGIPERNGRSSGKNPHAAALGRLGGLVGGRVRAASLSPRERQKIARKAARARWTRSKAAAIR